MVVRVEFNESQIQEISRALSPKQFRRATRKGVNQTGSDLRKRVKPALQALVKASAAAMRVKGKAASSHQAEPNYRLTFAKRIPIKKLRSSARKIRSRKGRQYLFLTQPGDQKTVLGPARRVGVGKASFVQLLRAGRLKERAVGGINLRADAWESYGPLKRLRSRASKDLVRNISQQIEAGFRPKTNRGGGGGGALVGSLLRSLAGALR